MHRVQTLLAVIVMLVCNACMSASSVQRCLPSRWRQRTQRPCPHACIIARPSPSLPASSIYPIPGHGAYGLQVWTRSTFLVGCEVILSFSRTAHCHACPPAQMWQRSFNTHTPDPTKCVQRHQPRSPSWRVCRLTPEKSTQTNRLVHT